MRNALTACMAMLLVAGAAGAQSTRETQRKLERIQHELKDVATQRREIAGERNNATQQLRSADEQLGHSGRALNDTQTQLTREQAALQTLQQQRDALQSTLGARRRELAGLLRAAYAVPSAAPLQAVLSQDRVADASRVLTLHAYLERDRARRIAQLTAQLQALDTVETRIAQTRAQLATTRTTQQAQLAQLQRDRLARAAMVARLDAQYRDRTDREQSLSRDAQGLETVLAQLRAAAAREAQRRAAAARAIAAQRAAASAQGRPLPRPRPPLVANAAPLQVGGLGWPVSGSLLARFGGPLPDGGTSQGVLIAAPAGTPVDAVANGRVVFADWMNGYGLLLIIDHGNGNMSLYAHNEALLRDVGATITRGQPVASVGNSGSPGRTALYFELRRNGQPVDPMGWLQKH